MPYAGQYLRDRLKSAAEAKMQAELDFDTQEEINQMEYEEYLASAAADNASCGCGHELHGKVSCSAFNCPCQQSYLGWWN